METAAEIGVVHLQARGSLVSEFIRGFVLGYGARTTWVSESPPTVS